MLAIGALLVLSLAVAGYITQKQRLRIPGIQENPFDLKFELSNAQAVTGGQGQTVRIAGVEVGQIKKVEVRNGKAIVTTEVKRKFLPIYKNATGLLRPKTALKDMFIELDPGDVSAGRAPEGFTVPSANTLPDVNLDEILSALDKDSRDYLKLLLVGAGKGLQGRSRDLGELLSSFGPLNRDISDLAGQIKTRRVQLAHVVHNFQVLTGELARNDDELVSFVNSSNSAVGALAEESPSLQRTIQLLPGTLVATRQTLERIPSYADTLGNTLNDLRPFARRLPTLNAAVRRLSIAEEPTVRTQLRPFARELQPRLKALRPPIERYSRASPDLTTLFTKVNRLTNLAAYNPHGREAPGTPNRSEGYLFWAAWLGHNGNSVFANQDAHGVFRRLYLTTSCRNIVDLLAASPLTGIALGPTTEPVCSALGNGSG